MKIDEQISTLRMVERANDLDLSEIIQSLEEIKSMFNETDRDLKAHRYHFLAQDLTGRYLPPAKTGQIYRDKQPINQPKLEPGDWVKFMDQTLQFKEFNKDEMIVLDNKGKPRTIPKIRWNEVKQLKTGVI